MICQDDYSSRGWEVHPSFVESALLDESLLMQMEEHPEAAGKSSWGTRNVLHAFILAMRPKVVLEIGGHIGSGSVVMGSALRANGFGKLYVLEPQQHYFALIEKFVKEAGVDSYVQPLRMFSTDASLPSVLGEKVDMVFLDANHSYSHAYRDLEIVESLIAPNGMVFLDDVGPDLSAKMCEERRGGVRQALLDFSLTRPHFRTLFLEPPFWLNPCGMAICCAQTF